MCMHTCIHTYTYNICIDEAFAQQADWEGVFGDLRGNRVVQELYYSILYYSISCIILYHIELTCV